MPSSVFTDGYKWSEIDLDEFEWLSMLFLFFRMGHCLTSDCTAFSKKLPQLNKPELFFFWNSMLLQLQTVQEIVRW